MKEPTSIPKVDTMAMFCRRHLLESPSSSAVRQNRDDQDLYSRKDALSESLGYI